MEIRMQSDNSKGGAEVRGIKVVQKSGWFRLEYLQRFQRFLGWLIKNVFVSI